jgi:hypothetical protein
MIYRMSDNVLQQFRGRVVSEPHSFAVESEGEDDMGEFAILRGVRDFARFLELRKTDGSVVAIGYSWLERIEYDGVHRMTLRFTNQVVNIVGRNLNAEIRPNVRLLDGLVRHRVTWIREFSERDALVADKRRLVIEEIMLEM